MSSGQDWGHRAGARTVRGFPKEKASDAQRPRLIGGPSMIASLTCTSPDASFFDGTGDSN